MQGNGLGRMGMTPLSKVSALTIWGQAEDDKGHSKRSDVGGTRKRWRVARDEGKKVRDLLRLELILS